MYDDMTRQAADYLRQRARAKPMRHFSPAHITSGGRLSPTVILATTMYLRDYRILQAAE